MQFKNRLIGAVLSVAMLIGFVSPLTAVARETADVNYATYSIEQLESLISKLQKQLEELKKGSKCFISDTVLSLGDGEPGDGMANEVRRLQMFLKEKTNHVFGATGYFGKFTKAALQSFQKNQGLAATGEFDAATREKAHAMYCRNAAKVVTKEMPQKEEKKENNNNEKKEIVGTVRGISLSVASGIARWKVDGYSAKGFKVIWSKNSSPVFPTREGDSYAFYESPSAGESALSAFAGSGTYYVRVCQYLGGACGTYSNEVITQL